MVVKLDETTEPEREQECPTSDTTRSEDVHKGASLLLQINSNPLRAHGLPSELAQSVMASCAGASFKIATSCDGQGQYTGSPVLERLVAISPAL